MHQIAIGILLACVALLWLLWREFQLRAAIPMLANRLRLRGERELARRMLERAVGMWSLGGERSRLRLRLQLSWVCLELGRHDEAIEQCRSVLSKTLKPMLENQVRERLATILESAGRSAEADAERAHAQERLGDERDQPLRLLADARRLEKEGKHDEACDTYEAAISGLAATGRRPNGISMANYALAAFNAGRMEMAVTRADEALSLPLPPAIQIVAHRTAAMACRQLGRLDESEQRHRTALQLAEKSGSQDEAARSLVMLAGLQMHRGRLVEAIADCDRAAQMSHKSRRSARLTQADCLRVQGLFHEALDMVEQASRAQGVVVPRAERRSQALLLLERCWLCIEIGELDRAQEHLASAAAELGSDSRIGLWCTATAAWLDAASGRREAACAKMAEVEKRLPGIVADVQSVRTCLGQLGRAAADLSDWRKSREYWERYLLLGPEPVWRPRALFEQGRACECLGDPESARRCYELAVADGLQTLGSRLARERLQQLNANAGISRMQ